MSKDAFRGAGRLSAPSILRAAPLFCAGAVASVVTSASCATAASNPRQDYDVDVTCAAASAAARTVPGSVDAVQRSKADQLAQITLTTAEVAGERLGIGKGAVLRAVDGERDTVLRTLRVPDPTEAASQRTELGRTLIRCALLHAIETARSRPGGQPGL